MRSQELCWESMQLRTGSMGSKPLRPTYLIGDTPVSNSYEARKMLMMLTVQVIENS